MADQDRTPPTPLDAFLAAFWEDRWAGAVRPLEDYLALFPGDAKAIARQYLAVEDGATAPSPDHVAHYRKIRQIGRGGQGTVYLAEDTRLHRQVALKIMDPGFASDAIAVERFKREAEITSKLDHPGICTVYETGEDRGSRWISMRYVEGESLAKKVSTAKEEGSVSTFVVLGGPSDLEARPTPSPPDDPTGPKTWADISRLLQLFENAARALHVAHEVGIIHRDIKPGNMMVTTDGKPVILDFGLAVDMGGDLPTLTMSGDLMGTKEYMSPEQIAAHRITLDRRTDVYSLGVSLFECLALRRPFEAPTREGLYEAIMTKAPPDLRRLNPALPADLRVVVATAIEKERDRRYQTALDLAEELRRVRMHEPIVAKPVGPLVRFGRWAQRNPALATAVGGLFAVLTIGFAVAMALLSASLQERSAKEAALADYERLVDQPRLDRLIKEARDLWPGHPDDTVRLKSWIDRASDLATPQDRHRQLVNDLRAHAVLAPSGGSREHPASRPTSMDPNMWRFESESDQFKHDTTARLIAALEAFADPDPAKGLIASVRWRFAAANSIDLAATWAAAIRSIADSRECPAYGGLRITPQRGLIPIGRDSSTRLWEFVHVQTAAAGLDPVPKRDEDDRFVVTEWMGVVLVLLPGATFNMGAVKPSESRPVGHPNVDPGANDDEEPVTQVTLDPFFLSKYEMTRAQWFRIDTSPRASLRSESDDPTLPVANVSWEDCSMSLAQVGLNLPTEAQWEYAAISPLASLRWTVPDNERDSHERRKILPIGSFQPNPFGLHDTLRNVSEWCRDEFCSYSDPPRGGDGLRGRNEPVPSERLRTRARVVRGAEDPTESSILSTRRESVQLDTRYVGNGVRPARRLDP